ncbi:MutS domain-containing protein [Myxococcus stipitatus DSM 14675]|uniref:MutS domain-containing protein n=1 Tax=Myxococcus stipitatus (strain DSM 14675 / JCM 12634 / Mx s8) TaxID=1278073 RepID=L7UG97_MYXSD|nr:MutS domain-containing protein [Myxococcus stipitatus]AGC46910.1 MutS domain-containing protein [Myxococcus stipitatus DSM 14675]
MSANVTPPTPHTTYTERRASAQAELSALDRVSARYANLRTLAFLFAVVLGGLIITGRIPKTWWWGAVGAAVAYGVLAVLHHQIFRREARQRLYVTLNERGLARLGHGWHEFPERGERFASPSHLYTPDLDVFGQGSLFQLLNETATRAGEERLASWLSAPASVETVEARQGAARELAPRVDFRQDLCVDARTVAKEKADPALFIQWAEAGPSLTSIRWSRPLALLLPPVTLALFILGEVGVLPGSSVWAGLAAQLAVAVATRRTLRKMDEAVEKGEQGFVRYAPLFERMESQRFEHPLLRNLQQGLQPQGEPPVSAHFHRFSQLFSLIEFKRHQFHPLVHWLTLWDIHALFALENWRAKHGAHLRHWFESLAELEALSCVAGLAHDRPAFAWPTLEARGPVMEAKQLGHPLLDAPVPNDVALPGPGHALVITGSNMSGKTTLMRAMGTNVVLALAGAPVCATSLRLSPLQVLTSMRVKDSLERGVSYFYAEVQRIKAVLDAARAANGQALFLLDEILLGTNTRERQLASREVLRLLLSTGAAGAVTTHDLSLTALAEEAGAHVLNVHFRDHLEDGKMVFDYTLREGVVDTTNALRVLRLAGVPVDDPEAPAS